MFNAGADLLQCLPELQYKSKHFEARRVPASRHFANTALQQNTDIQLALDIARAQLPHRITNLPIASSDEMLPLAGMRHAPIVVPAFTPKTPKPIARHPYAALRVDTECVSDSRAPHDPSPRVIPLRHRLDLGPGNAFDSESSGDEDNGADADDEDSEYESNEGDNDSAVHPYARSYSTIERRPIITGAFGSLIGALEGILDDAHDAAESLERSNQRSNEDDVQHQYELAHLREPSPLDSSAPHTPIAGIAPIPSAGASTSRSLLPIPRSFGRRKPAAHVPPELDISGWSLVGSEEVLSPSWPASAGLVSGLDASPTTPTFAFSVPQDSSSTSRRRTNSASSTRSGKNSRLSAVFSRLRPGSAPSHRQPVSPKHLSPTFHPDWASEDGDGQGKVGFVRRLSDAVDAVFGDSAAKRAVRKADQ